MILLSGYVRRDSVMKLAISNIAWQQHNDTEILSGLRERGVRGIEIAPTKVWPEWQGACTEEAILYGNRMRDAGFELPAMQAILFGQPELQVFDQTSHGKFIDHIKNVADLAQGMGVKVLVFGAPKNRIRGQLQMHDAMVRATDFFRNIAEICHERNCCIGLEHNPVEYGCDFVTNVADAKELVEMVDHPGFQLHLDSAGIHMCGSNMSDVIRNAQEFVHFHISEPMLEPISGGVVDHMSAADTLIEIGYTGWVSIEMKMVPDIKSLYRSVDAAASCYVK